MQKIGQSEHLDTSATRNQRQQTGDGLTIRIDEVRFGQGILRRHKPITLHPRPSACGKYFDVEFEDIDMTLTESSVAELKSATKAALEMTWELYAEGDPEEMTPGAQELGQHMRATYTFLKI